MRVRNALFAALFALSLTLGVAVARPAPTHPVINGCSTNSCWG